MAKDKQADEAPAPVVSAVPPRASGSLLEENAALREVSRALAEGKPDEALRILETGPTSGRLDEERLAARIVALCKAGRQAEAAPLRAAFAAEHPRSNQRARISSACAESVE